jgi:hypothetical protein
VVSFQAKNQFSKPSTEMELIQWPRAARSTTREQDRCLCVILHISSWRYGHIPCSDVSMMTVICVYVILHLKRHAFVIIFVQYNFLYDLPTHLQSLWLSQQFGKSSCFSHDSWCKLNLDLASEIMPDCWRWTLFLLVISF